MGNLTSEQIRVLLDKAIAEGTVTPVHALYNRVSLDCEIPLAVAEAMARSAGIYQMVMAEQKEERMRRNVAANWATLWLKLSDQLSVPAPRLERAITQIIDGIMAINKQVGELQKKVEGEKTACA